MKLNLIALAAVAAFGVAGQANAGLTQSNSGNPGSMFLYVYDATAGGTNSALLSLGTLTNSFNSNLNQTWDMAALGGTTWSTYIAPLVSAGKNVQWGVFGAFGTNATGSYFDTTVTSGTPGTESGGGMGTTVANANNTMLSGYGLNDYSGHSAPVANNDIISATWGNNSGNLPFTATAGLGTNMNFFKFTSTGTKASNNATVAQFQTAGFNDYFTLSNTGTLNYTATAAVPEADTYALMLAGLGLVGFLARRRKAV